MKKEEAWKSFHSAVSNFGACLIECLQLKVTTLRMLCLSHSKGTVLA